MITRETKLEEIAKHFHKVMCTCGALIGETHLEGCDVARCRKCGDQAWVSDCGKWKPDVWTGWWPGTIEAINNDLWSYWGPDYGMPGGWIECDSTHPGAGPDLNRQAILRVSGR